MLFRVERLAEADDPFEIGMLGAKRGWVDHDVGSCGVQFAERFVNDVRVLERHSGLEHDVSKLVAIASEHHYSPCRVLELYNTRKRSGHRALTGPTLGLRLEGLLYLKSYGRLMQCGVARIWVLNACSRRTSIRPRLW